MYGESPQTLAEGKNPSSAKPDNAKANQALAKLPLFARLIELKPEHVCHSQGNGLRDPLDPKAKMETAEDIYSRPEKYFSRHAESSDVWEAVHKKTGMPIVADYYTRLYAQDSVQMSRMSVFDALCKEGDALGVKWRKDGDFLLCRSSSYFWDKLKEVPRRQLERWAQDSQSKDGLPLEDLLEMATCSDASLDSALVGQGVLTCWNLSEWERVAISRDGRRDSPMAGTSFRTLARCLAGFPQILRDPLLQPGGIRLNALPMPQRQELAKALANWNGSTEYLLDSQVHLDYLPAGRYVWNPPPGNSHLLGISADQVVSGRTLDEALAAAQKVDPGATKSQIHRTRSVFAIELKQAGSNLQVIGTPMVTLH